MTNDNNSKKSYLDSDATGQQLPKSTYKLQEWPRGGSQTTLSSKFEEIKTLLNSYHSSAIVNTILANLAQQIFYDGGNDHVVDQYLIRIKQKINLLQALDNLLPAKDSITGTNTSEQGLQRGSPHSPFRDVDEAAAIRLVQIKLLLTPHYPQQFVMNVITGLTKKYISTGDCTFLDEAFERHCANIRRRTMRE